LALGRSITFGMLILSGLVCLPFAALATCLLLHANQLAALSPWLLISATWLVVWLVWRAKLWLVACFLLGALIAVFTYGWIILELS
jgi:hypothetical protein